MCICSAFPRTDLVELDEVGFGAQLAQEGFGCFAVWAVGFGEDGYRRSAGSLQNFPYSVTVIRDIPTALSSMIPWALARAAMMSSGLGRAPLKKVRRKLMVGDCVGREAER